MKFLLRLQQVLIAHQSFFLFWNRAIKNQTKPLYLEHGDNQANVQNYYCKQLPFGIVLILEIGSSKLHPKCILIIEIWRYFFDISFSRADQSRPILKLVWNQSYLFIYYNS